MDWVRPKQLVQNLLWIDNNQQISVINFHRDFLASMHSVFFQGKIDRGSIYWPNHSGENELSKQEEEIGQSIDIYTSIVFVLFPQRSRHCFFNESSTLAAAFGVTKFMTSLNMYCVILLKFDL